MGADAAAWILPWVGGYEGGFRHYFSGGGPVGEQIVLVGYERLFPSSIVLPEKVENRNGTFVRG